MSRRSSSNVPRLPSPSMNQKSISNSPSEHMFRPKTSTLPQVENDPDFDHENVGGSFNNMPKRMLANMRICYVCGYRISKNAIEIHEKKCLQTWINQTENLPSHIKVSEPSRLNYPSIDGTVDTDRMEKLSLKSASIAQKVHCKKCDNQVALSDTREHIHECRGKGRRRK